MVYVEKLVMHDRKLIPAMQVRDLDSELYAKLKVEAKRLNINIGFLLNAIIEDYFEKKGDSGDGQA